MKKKILIVSASFEPEISPRSFRTTELAKELARKGHQVTVLTRYLEEHHAKITQGYGIKFLALPATFFVPLLGTKVFFLKRVLFKLLFELGLSQYFDLPYINYQKTVPKVLLTLTERFDLLISIAMPHAIHWGISDALEQKPELATRWIADCGDPYMGNPFHKRPKRFEKFERKFCERADYITVPVPSAIEGYYPAYRSKIKVIPQGFNFTEDRASLVPYVPHAIPHFAYSGVFYENKRDPRAFLDYLLSLDQDFRLYLYSPSTKLLKPYADASEGRVVLKKPLPRKDLLIELSKMDFLLNINNNGSVQNPSKIIDYRLVGRPILSLANHQNGAGLIEEFLEFNYTHQFKSDVDLESYHIEQVAQQFLNLASCKKA